LSHVACRTIEGIYDSRLNVAGTFPNRPHIPGMWKQKLSKQRQRGNNAATEHRCESCMLVTGIWGPWTFICLQTNVFEEYLQSHAKVCKDHVPTAFVDYDPPLCRVITCWTEKKQCCKWTSSFCEWPWWTRIHHFGWSGHPEKERRKSCRWRMKLICYTDVTHELIAVIAA
jgi:hypothetical protein